MAKIYKHTLICNNDASSVVLDFSPKGWDDKGYTFQENETYNGVLSSFSLGKLGFIKDKGALIGGLNFIQSKYELYGVEADISDQIEERNPANNQLVSWNTVKLTWEGDSDQLSDGDGDAIYFKIVDNSDKEFFRNNDELNLNILRDTDLQGNSITVKPTKNILITEQEIYNAGQISNATLSYSPAFNVEPTPDTIQFAATGELLINANTRTTLPNAPNSYELYRNDSGEDKNLSIEFDGDIYCLLQGAVIPDSGTVSFTFQNRLEVYDNTDALIFTDIGFTVSSPVLNFGEEFDLTNTGNLAYSNLILPDGYYVKLLTELVYVVTDSTVINFDVFEFSNGRISVLEKTNTIAASRSDVILAFEACENLLKIMTGNTSPLYSTILGRTDLGYSSDGFLALNAFTTGWNIRGFDLNFKEITLAFRSVFKTLNAINPIFLSYDNENSRFVIEDISQRYDSEIMLEVDYPSNFRRVFSEKMYFNNLLTGQKNKVEYESFNGAEESNTPTEFATSLPFKNDYNIRADYNLDPTGVEVLRQLQRFTVGNIDTKNDNNIYCLHLERDGINFQTKRFTGEVENVFNGSTRLNLEITQKRNLLRHGRMISSIYHKNSSGVFSYINSQLNSDMGTKLPSESAFVYENADVNVSDLDIPYFIPETIFFDWIFSREILDKLNSNPNRQIKVTTRIGVFYGFLNSEGIRSDAYDRTGNYSLKVQSFIPIALTCGRLDFQYTCNSQYLTTI